MAGNEVAIERTGANRIEVVMRYREADLRLMRQVAGRRFQRKPYKHWTVPLDLNTCRKLRTLFGARLVVGPQLHSWAINERRREESLGSMALEESATLTRLPAVLPGLYDAIHLGPRGLVMTDEEKAKARQGPGSYQTADVAFMASSIGPLNGNQPGTGKTPELIGAVWEAGLEEGNHLVICPKTAVDGTWEDELIRWQEDAPKDVWVFPCTGNKKQRQAMLEEFAACDAPVKWLVVNPAMIMYRKDSTNTSSIVRKARPKDFLTACHCDKMKSHHWHYQSAYPEIAETVWTTITIDEAHKGIIRNHRSLTSFSIHDLTSVEGGKRFVLTGTPMKKKGGSDIWGLLHWLRPDVFTSYWRFAEDYFEIHDNGYGKKVGELKPEMADLLFAMLKPYMLRRLKSEVAPWLPPKHFVDVWVTLEGKQADVYAQMEDEGFARLADTTVNTTSILAEFTRLQQFANALCIVREKDGKVIPTEESAKLVALYEKLDERGIFDESQTEKVVIFSQYREMIDLLTDLLRAKGVKADKLTGKENKQGQRKALRKAFQEEDLRVLCIVTTAGGVSLTLDAADSAHFLDEMWAPDEQEQAEDRIHRVSRAHQVTIYNYRARDTIDEYKQETAAGKRESHEFILDVRREVLAKAAAA